MKKILYFILFIFSSNMILAEFKNVQVLEFDSEKDLKKYMKSISKDLSVKCSFCHDLNDKSIDTEHKLVARDMIRMQIDLNENYFAHMADTLAKISNLSPISCWTCHSGYKKPQLVRPK